MTGTFEQTRAKSHDIFGGHELFILNFYLKLKLKKNVLQYCFYTYKFLQDLRLAFWLVEHNIDACFAQIFTGHDGLQCTEMNLHAKP